MLKHCFATIEYSAVGNHGLAINDAMAENGFDLEMYSETIRPEFRNRVIDFETFKKDLRSDDVVFYQFANPSPMADLLYERKSRLVLNYHSITPAYFFDRYDLHTCEAISRARTQLARLAPVCSAAVAVSDSNARELIEITRITRSVPAKFGQSDLNRWLFVGRIAPHKSTHKIIEAFDFYLRNVDSQAKLTLVGKSDVPLYGKKIEKLIADRNLSDSVEIIENCPLDELSEIYTTSSVSGAGILIDSQDPATVAMAVCEVLENTVLKEELINKGLIRAQMFHPENTLKSYVDYLAKWY